LFLAEARIKNRALRAEPCFSLKLEITSMKKVITHINPDLDAVTSVWLIKRFLPGWEEAKVGFAPAGEVKGVDLDPEVLYVDTGRGKLDHHQTGRYLSASQLCLTFLKKQRKGQSLSPLEEKALQELVAVVTNIDNARDLSWKEVSLDRYQFYLHTLIEGLRGLAKSDKEVIDLGMILLDAVLLNFKNKIRADEELVQGKVFQSQWGKAIGLISGNQQTIWRGEAKGYVLVVKKDPEEGGVRIYSRYDSKVDLTKAYNQVRKKDPDSDWFLHASKKLLLNQASANPNMRPTKLSLNELIKILKK
jgi:hypothetical protein